MNPELSRVRLLLFSGVVLVALAALFALVGRHDFEQLRSFHVIADVSQTGTQAPAADEPGVTRIEGWYREGKVRWELSYSGPNAPPQPSIEMTDGKTTYYYDATKETYFEEPLISADFVAFFGIGPIPQFSIADFERQQRKSESLAGSTTESGTYLGQDVFIVTTKALLSAGGERVTLTAQYTIDPAYMFSVAYQVDTDVDDMPGALRYAATEVHYNVPISKDEFVFVPPATAERIAPPVWSPANLVRTAKGIIDAPDGFFRPTRLPQNYRLTARQNFATDEGQAPKFLLNFSKDESFRPGYLEIDQAPATTMVPNDQRSDDIVRINDAQGFFTTTGKVTNLSWLRGDVLITLHADELSRDQMLSVARSMR
ncbi:MAG TPA: hypothetical protein VFY10_15010 [Dehalococcoidia bacterium]|nr:hypothetical protein [Dehalococcoidia bacterium]